MSAQAAWMSGHMEMVSQSDKLLPPLQQSTILVNDDDDHSDKEANGSARPGKRRRNRAVLSCSNCKSRKIKCSRQIPCEACIRRGVANTCQWHTEEFVPPPQVFALESSVDAIRAHFEDRIAHLESLLKVQATVTSAAVAKQAVQDAYQGRNGQSSIHHDSRENTYIEQDVSFTSKQGGSTAGPAQGRPTSSKRAENHLDIENAALSLEVLASGAGGVADDEDEVELKPWIPGLSETREQFAAQSIIVREFDNGIEGNPRLPYLAYNGRSNLVEQVIAFAQGSHRTQPIVDMFYETIGLVFQVIRRMAFLREHTAFWLLVGTGERQFDPAWLGELCIVMACAMQARPEFETETMQAEDAYLLAKACLDANDWRRKPSMRVIAVLLLSAIYMYGQNNLTAGRLHLQEAIRVATNLGLHKLGEDRARMPPKDIGVRPGSLAHREQAVRVWWELVTQDWMGSILGFSPSIGKDDFDTPLPSNFTDEDIDTQDFAAIPRPMSEGTEAIIQLGKAMTAIFVREQFDLGPLPHSDVELVAHYNKMLQLEREYMESTKNLYAPLAGMWLSNPDDWRSYIGKTGLAQRRARLWRPFMVRGYSDKRFAYATTTCVESAQDSLKCLRRLYELDAPLSSLWFLTRHILSSVVVLLLDALHDVDVGVPAEESEKKLVNLGFAANLFAHSEKSKSKTARTFARRANLLIKALLDTKEARRQTRGSGTTRDYREVLKNIAQTVKGSPAESAQSISSTRPGTSSGTNGFTPPSSEVSWLEDPETQRFLQSLGLANPLSSSTGIIPSPSTSWSSNVGDSTLYGSSTGAGWDPTIFGTTFSTGLDALESSLAM